MSGATVAVIPALHLANALSLPLLLGLVFAGALLDAPGGGGTARDTLLPDLIERAGIRAERVNGLYCAVSRSASLVWPPLAGVLIGLVGATAVLWIDAATFAVSALAIGVSIPNRLCEHPGYRDSGDQETPGSAGALAQIRAGATFVWRNPLLRTLILVVAFTNLVDAPFGVALAVSVREQMGRPEALGLLFAAHGGCAVAGALVYGAVGHRLPRRPIYVVCFVVVSLSFGLLATTPSFPVALLALALTGAAAGPINPILMTVLQEHVPAGMRGRVFGAVRAIAWSAMPAGVLAGSALIEVAGTGPTFASAAAGYVIAGAFLAPTPSLGRMGRPLPKPVLP